MLRELKRGLQKHGFRKYAGRTLRKHIDRVVAPLNLKTITAAFEGIGLEKGVTVCVHSSLSRLGYIKGGAETVIEALMEIVGSEGCILMPSFSMSGSMLEYIEQGEPFDVRMTPSRIGTITETFRKRSAVVRSLHPTNSLAGWGKGAEDLLRDHEKSITPFGPGTPYGRLAEMDDSYILMIETHVHSLLHHLQERVNFPNLYLPDQREVAVIDKHGEKRNVITRVMRPRTPYFIAIPSSSSAGPGWAILHDFALMFPKRREKIVKELGYNFDGYPELYRRREELEKSSILRSTKIGRGEIGLLHIKKFLNRIEPELSRLIEKFRPAYDVDRISDLDLPYS